MGSGLFSPAHVVAVAKARSRLDAAKLFGADVTINPSSQSPVEVIKEFTGGLGADVSMEAYHVFTRAGETAALKVVLTRA